MAVLRTDIERALDEFSSQEEGMRFQSLAVILGKKRWPELIARQRKKDFGLDGYASASQTPEKMGKGLAASITPTLNKISADLRTAKTNFPDLRMLLFVTPAKVGNAERRRWETAIQSEFGVELHLIEREEIITLMSMPDNASLRASYLHLISEPEPSIADLIARTNRAAAAVTGSWASRTKGHPLIELTMTSLDPAGAESDEPLSLDQVECALLQGARVVLEAPAGRGKTTTLVQLAERCKGVATPFIIDLPAWTSSRRNILSYIADMPVFQAEGLTAADLALAQQDRPFVLLLNGWNEVTESNSEQATIALSELERQLPNVGIIVATRSHHLSPPLPGATRVRLLPLLGAQRRVYLQARLGETCNALRARIDADPTLDELTRTPFVLAEVVSLFEAGVDIPSTRIGVLSEVLRLHERRDEHRNALQSAPIYGYQGEYLTALAMEMTRRGAVSLLEADARTVVARVARSLIERGLIERAAAPDVLAGLTAHHVLERVDYPQPSFQFEHQQLQEHYAAIDLRARLYELRPNDREAMERFTVEYVNEPAWEESLLMIAETFANEGEASKEVARGAGLALVSMALDVDLIFASDLAYRCGPDVWKEVREKLIERARTIYGFPDDRYKRYAIAAMLATGADEFADTIVPLLSAKSQQTRLSTYRLWPEFDVSSLGPNWRTLVSGWPEDARADFVSEVLHSRLDVGVAEFAIADSSATVKLAAASGLMWTRSDDELTRVLQSMEAPVFEEFTRRYASEVPAALKPRAVAALQQILERELEPTVWLNAALDLIQLGCDGHDAVIKESLTALAADEKRNLNQSHIEPALEHLRSTDPQWLSEWVANQVATGRLFDPGYWLPFAVTIPESLVERLVQTLSTEDHHEARLDGMIAVIATQANEALVSRAFGRLRELQANVDREPDAQRRLEWNLIRQLKALLRGMPDDILVAGVLSAVNPENESDGLLTADLLSRVARPDMPPLRIENAELKSRMRAFLKSCVDGVLRRDDFNGEEKADLISALAQVGEREDMADLLRLIRADIERLRRGRAARAAGNRGPQANGATMSYTHWNIEGLTYLDDRDADTALIELLAEPEYRSDVATAMTRDFLPIRDRPFDRSLDHDLVWLAREGSAPAQGAARRRQRFAAALTAEFGHLREESRDGKVAAGLRELANALAVVDAHGSSAELIETIARPGNWVEYISVQTAERLLMAGVTVPAAAALAVVDSLLERTQRWMQDWERALLLRALSILPFVDDPLVGIAKVREVLASRRIRGHELRGLITALGASRSDAALDVLEALSSDTATFEQCGDTLISAIAALDTPRAHELLLGFVDPQVRGIEGNARRGEYGVLIDRLADLAVRKAEIRARLHLLCERSLASFNRYILSKVLQRLGQPDDEMACLNLVDDAAEPPIPQGVWDLLENAFVERRPDRHYANAFTQHARGANQLRKRLFQMAIDGPNRRVSAWKLLGQIEEWRIEHGRPASEPRHPDLASGRSWPLASP